MDYLTLRLVSFILSNSIVIPLLAVYSLQLIFLCYNRDIYNSTFYKLFVFQGILVGWKFNCVFDWELQDILSIILTMIFDDIPAQAFAFPLMEKIQRYPKTPELGISQAFVPFLTIVHSLLTCYFRSEVIPLQIGTVSPICSRLHPFFHCSQSVYSACISYFSQEGLKIFFANQSRHFL